MLLFAAAESKADPNDEPPKDGGRDDLPAPKDDEPNEEPASADEPPAAPKEEPNEECVEARADELCRYVDSVVLARYA